MAGVSRPGKSFTPKQGQYLAFIHLYTRLHRRPPAETDMQEYFRVSPPSVHQMVLTLERAGFIRRRPRTPRSMDVPGRQHLGEQVEGVRTLQEHPAVEDVDQSALGEDADVWVLQLRRQLAQPVLAVLAQLQKTSPEGIDAPETLHWLETATMVNQPYLVPDARTRTSAPEARAARLRGSSSAKGSRGAWLISARMVMS